MVATPVAMPVTMPELPIAATPLLLLLQDPPEVVLLKAVAAPTQTAAEPVIVPAAGNGFTVTVVVANAVPQLLVAVYVIVAVPAPTPVTTPVLPMEAIDVLLLLHEPPAVLEELLNVTVAPAHTVEEPVMLPAATDGLTVTVAVARSVPQIFVTE